MLETEKAYIAGKYTEELRIMKEQFYKEFMEL